MTQGGYADEGRVVAVGRGRDYSESGVTRQTLQKGGLLEGRTGSEGTTEMCVRFWSHSGRGDCDFDMLRVVRIGAEKTVVARWWMRRINITNDRERE